MNIVIWKILSDLYPFEILAKTSRSFYYFFTYPVSLHRQSYLLSLRIFREIFENIRNIKEPLQFSRPFQITLLLCSYPSRGRDKTSPSYARPAWRCHPATLFWTYTNLTGQSFSCFVFMNMAGFSLYLANSVESIQKKRWQFLFLWPWY